jgi:NhaP-type Na+/H+ or K+/H+ antiporter
MQPGGGPNPALTVALALAAGVIGQALARHLRVPGIVLLLAAGVLLGPDVLGVVDPSALGPALDTIVGFSVAIILFEGGLNLDWRRLRREAAVLQRLLVIGAILTTLGGALAVRVFLGWSWTLSLLFGTLVIVTGPTVITPLLRRTKVRRKLETILEAEGVLIDAVGAIIAIVALEIVVSPAGSSTAFDAFHVPGRLIGGALIGLVGGALIALVLRFRHVVPEGLENVVTLCLALALFQISNSLMPETGIASVIVAGMIVGNSKTPVKRELREFKEQLTLMVIGLLFVLLAADVRVAEVISLGWGGLAVVAALVFVVRPLSVVACMWGAGHTWKEKAFVSWVAPRGIVAAAVSSIFAERLDAANIDGGLDLRALVFLVILTTVVVQGPTVEVVASLLGVRKPTGRGYAILGATPLGRALGRTLARGDEDVVVFDANPDASRDAQEDGLRVVFGNALEESVLARSELDTRAAVVGMLPNAAVNLLFARKSREEFRVKRAYVALQLGQISVNPEQVHEVDGRVLFGEPTDLELWSVRLRRGLAELETRVRDAAVEGSGKPWPLPEEIRGALIPLAHRSSASWRPVSDRSELSKNAVVVWLVFTERREEAHAWLEEKGWRSEA